MSRTLPKQFNPLITIEVAPTYDELLARRRLGQTNLSVKPAQIGTSNATKPENLGVFEYAHLRAPLPKDLEGSEIFPSHSPQQHPESYFLMRRSKDGYVSATGMFKIAFPWAKAEEERTEREYLKAREYTSEEEVAGNVWISPAFALELSKEYRMYDWVRALLDPTDIVQSPSSAKKHITPPPKFEIPSDEPPVSQRNRRGRSASPSKKLSPRKPRSTRIAKDVTSTPSTTAANASLQSALDTASGLASDAIPELRAVDGEAEVTSSGSPGKKTRARRAATAEPEEETKEETKEKKEKKKAERKEKKKQEIQEQEETVEASVETSVADDATDAGKSTHTTVSLDMPISLPEVPSAAETEEMIAQAKEMVEEAIKAQAEGATAESTSVQTTSKRKAVDDEDEETSAEASQRAKKAKVLENKLKQERVRNRSIFGVSVAFALAASIPYFF
ncbi:unnamed protein product [Penicillium egyptiacum]|uniref:Cell pattern formation-associated protein stuA n=1 Tax=Penicillium egyptiacum TaxID=1303716 RepID=A0A9W4KI77_9EURO|nr:unnamed protein product [Penicillium egyptiacum]